MVFELLAQLARRVERIVFDDHRAEPQDRVERDDVLRAVRQHDRDRIAGADTLVAQPRGRAPDGFVQFSIRGRPAEELQGGCVGIVARGRLDDVDE